MTRSLAVSVAVVALLAVGASADAGSGRRKAGRKLGVRRLVELRSGPVVVGQEVDLAPGVRKLPGAKRLGRDHHGGAMELEDSPGGTLRFTNPRAGGLPITEVRTWDGLRRRWRVVFVDARGKRDLRPAATAATPRILREPVAASGRVDRPDGQGVTSVRLSTYLGRSSGVTRLAIDVFDRAGRPMNYHLELPAAVIADALAGLPVEEAGWQLGLTEQVLELRSVRGETLRIDRAEIERLWAGEPLAPSD